MVHWSHQSTSFSHRSLQQAEKPAIRLDPRNYYKLVVRVKVSQENGGIIGLSGSMAMPMGVRMPPVPMGVRVMGMRVIILILLIVIA